MIDKMDDFWAEPGVVPHERAGAMMWWRCFKRPDDPAPRPNPHLAVMTPAGLVCLDCPETGGTRHWTRTGEPPNVTVTPSLNVNHEEWHGWLTNGVLTP